MKNKFSFKITATPVAKFPEVKKITFNQGLAQFKKDFEDHFKEFITDLQSNLSKQEQIELSSGLAALTSDISIEIDPTLYSVHLNFLNAAKYAAYACDRTLNASFLTGAGKKEYRGTADQANWLASQSSMIDRYLARTPNLDPKEKASLLALKKQYLKAFCLRYALRPTTSQKVATALIVNSIKTQDLAMVPSGCHNHATMDIFRVQNHNCPKQLSVENAKTALQEKQNGSFCICPGSSKNRTIVVYKDGNEIKTQEIRFKKYPKPALYIKGNGTGYCDLTAACTSLGLDSKNQITPSDYPTNLLNETLKEGQYVFQPIKNEDQQWLLTFVKDNKMVQLDVRQDNGNYSVFDEKGSKLPIGPFPSKAQLLEHLGLEASYCRSIINTDAPNTVVDVDMALNSIVTTSELAAIARHSKALYQQTQHPDVDNFYEEMYHINMRCPIIDTDRPTVHQQLTTTCGFRSVESAGQNVLYDPGLPGVTPNKHRFAGFQAFYQKQAISLMMVRQSDQTSDYKTDDETYDLNRFLTALLGRRANLDHFLLKNTVSELESKLAQFELVASESAWLYFGSKPFVPTAVDFLNANLYTDEKTLKNQSPVSLLFQQRAQFIKEKNEAAIDRCNTLLACCFKTVVRTFETSLETGNILSLKSCMEALTHWSQLDTEHQFIDDTLRVKLFKRAGEEAVRLLEDATDSQDLKSLQFCMDVLTDLIYSGLEVGDKSLSNALQKQFTILFEQTNKFLSSFSDTSPEKMLILVNLETMLSRFEKALGDTQNNSELHQTIGHGIRGIQALKNAAFLSPIDHLKTTVAAILEPLKQGDSIEIMSNEFDELIEAFTSARLVLLKSKSSEKIQDEVKEQVSRILQPLADKISQLQKSNSIEELKRCSALGKKLVSVSAIQVCRTPLTVGNKTLFFHQLLQGIKA